MPLLSAPATSAVNIKVVLEGEARRVRLLNGTAIRLSELLGLLEERFLVQLEKQVTYVDDENEVIMVTTDIELGDALMDGVERLEVKKARQQLDDSWEFVGTTPTIESVGRVPVPWVSELRFWLNNEEVVLSNPSPNLTLLDWLRDVKGLNGMHVGCGEGGCGICTVALSQLSPTSGQVELVPINSCLRRLCAVDGQHVLTSQGIGTKKCGFHKVQSAIADGNGSQCGFCTPGWVMQMYALLEKNPEPSQADVETHFDGNLCRCTGYRPILRSFGKFAKDGSHCGQHQSVRHPPALLNHAPQPLHFNDSATQAEWYRPVTLEQFFTLGAEIAAKGLKIRPVCSKTGDGVIKYLEPAGRADCPTIQADISLLPELQRIAVDSEGQAKFGAVVPIATVIENLQSHAGTHASFGALAEHMKRIASVQIRSVASWAGNVMLTRDFPSFPSDMCTILAAAGATMQVMVLSGQGPLSLTVPELLAVKDDVLVISMTIPPCPPGSLFQTFKASQRSVFAHAIVNFAAFVAFEDDKRTVKYARFFVGGACVTLLDAVETASAVTSRALDQDTLSLAMTALSKEIAANPSQDQRHSQEYRQRLAAGFLYKTFLAAQASLPAQLKSAIEPFIPADARPISSGSENWGTDLPERLVSQYVPKLSSRIQASGEAVYPSGQRNGALIGQIVFSVAANAKLTALDPSRALKMPGVRGFVAASAVPGINCVNASMPDSKEKIFWDVGDTVPCVGSMLGLVLADTWAQARSAAKQVIQHFDGTSAAVTSIDDAMRLRRITNANMHAAEAGRRRGVKAEHAHGVEHVGIALPHLQAGGLSTAKGSFKTGGQSHFYMETQSVHVTPHDGGNWEVVISDQDSNFTQQCLALVLGVPEHHINVKVPRAGGAFGGKLTRHLLSGCAAAVAANQFQMPVHIQNERSDDMQMVVGREPINFDYEVTFDASTGRVDSMDMTMTMDPGWFYGDCSGDMAMAVGWSDNCYQYRSFRVTPKAAHTDTPHATSMRAPGCMQSILAAEVVLEQVAKLSDKPLEEVQALNFYKLNESPLTPFGDHIGVDGYNWTIPRLWSQVQEQSQFVGRKRAVEAYNNANRWTKKGIAISPVKYVMGIDSYSSGAAVCAYSDGTVLVSVGGSELGQGLNTKAALCAADALGIPLEKISVGPRETSKVPNNGGTGGSGTSECTAQAVALACAELSLRLLPYEGQGKSWEDKIAAANTDHVSLMVSSWYSFNKTANTNAYATYGTAITEVLVDILTGEVRVERVDILMDLGNQLDAAVDLGQLEGGFVISLGYLLTEELKVDSSGTQLNLGTWEYKIPTAYDIPVQFNVSLLKDSPNPVGIKGSKASAEPGMCLMPSAYLAVKNAIYAARRETKQNDGWFMLDVPLTRERVCEAIGVPTNQMLLSP